MSGRAIIVSRAGVARLAASDAACEDVLRNATPPAECGSDIPVAPARGPMVAVVGREMAVTAAGGVRAVKTGHVGAGEVQPRRHIRVADAFDVMERAARRAQRRVDPDKPFVPLFSPGQIGAGRRYAALSERVAASGVSCSSLEAVSRGGGGGREEAIFDDIARLRCVRRAIGSGLVKEVRRVRPSRNGGPGRRSIQALSLVDMVCVGGETLGGVLVKHGWSCTDAQSLRLLREGLCGALTRMEAYI